MKAEATMLHKMIDQSPLDEHRGVVVGICGDMFRECGAYRLMEIEDLIQEADVYLWERREVIACARNPKAFIRRLTRQAVVDCLRREGRSYSPPVDTMTHEQAA